MRIIHDSIGGSIGVFLGRELRAAQKTVLFSVLMTALVFLVAA